MRRINDRQVQVLNEMAVPTRSQKRSNEAHKIMAVTRGGNAMKTVLITLGVVCTLGVLLCAGLGVAGYFWFQKNMANLHVTDPVKIRDLTSEIVDITLPNELVPHHAASIFGTTMVAYQWCPTGTCVEGESSELTLVSIPDFGSGKNAPFDVDSASEEDLKERFNHFTTTIHEIEIRGKKVPFTFAFGDEKSSEVSVDEDLETKPMEDGSTGPDSKLPEAGNSKETDPATPEVTTPDPAAAPGGEGQKIWWISGNFLGKKGRCMLTLQLKPDQYDETKVLEMLRSIR